MSRFSRSFLRLCCEISPPLSSPHKLRCRACRSYSSLISTKYQEMVQDGRLKADDHQMDVVTQLEKLQYQLQHYQPRPTNQSSILGKIFRRSPPTNKIKGSGKTMLMDMFYDTITISKKRRFHFYEFMQLVHDKIHKFRESLRSSLSSSDKKSRDYDPISPVARQISNDVHLLCFDEFQVTDIGDAMILKGLFTALFNDGVIVVATSNRPPEDLYKNGLQRGNFLPFIDILKANCDVIRLHSEMDYRQAILTMMGGVYLTPNSAQNNEKLKSTFDKFAKDDGEVVTCKELTFLGRKLVVNKAAGSIAYFNFSDLCDEPLSSADYIELCRHFNTIFIQDIPKITQLMRSQARRFITLVDTLYDHKIRIVCTASEPPDRLFQTVSFNHRTNEYTRALMDDLDINQTDAESHSIFTGEEEAFAFERTVSRLFEMQTCEYWSSNKINRNIH